MPIAEIFLDARGLTGEQGPPRLKTGDLSVAENVSFFNLLQKEGGALRLNPIALSGGVRAGFDWWPTPTVQRRVVATADGKLLKDDMSGAFATTLKSGLAANRTVHIAECGGESAGAARKLVIANGVNPPQVLAGDGVTTTNLATPAADWSGTNQPTAFFPMRGVNIGHGNANRPHAIYGSLATNHEDFLSAGTFILNVFPGEGEGVAAGLTAIGRTFLFKHKRGVYFIDDSASTISGWFALPITRTYGVPNTPHCVTQVDQSTVAFLNSNGAPIFMQETFATITGVQFSDLFKALNFSTRAAAEFNRDRMFASQIRWEDEHKCLHVTYTAFGDSTQTRRMVIDFNGERTRVDISPMVVSEALWMERVGAVEVPVVGDDQGVVRRLQQDARTVDGLPYTLRVVTVPHDYGDQSPEWKGRKRFQYLYLEYIPTGTFDLTVRNVVDGVDQGAVTFKLSGSGTSPKRAVLGVSGEGYYQSLEILESGLNNPKICRMFSEFEVTGPRP